MNADIQIEQIPYYLTWKIRQEVMYPGKPIEQVQLPNDLEGLHFGLYVGITLTSVLSLFKQGDSMQFRKLATLQIAQHNGFGTLLLQHVIDFSRTEGATNLWCNARTNLTAYYEKFGFTSTENTFEDLGHNFVVIKMAL